jgi:hypothetical protein
LAATALEPRQRLDELALADVAVAHLVQARSQALRVHAAVVVALLLGGDRALEPRQRLDELPR